MKNILITFFKVSGLTMILGLASFLLMLLLFNDVLRESFFIVFIVIFLGGFTVTSSFLCMYLPIYYLNKSRFEQEAVKALYARYLPIVLLPLTLIAFIFLLSSPFDFYKADTLFVFIMGYIITLFSFYQFVRFIKTH